MTNIHATLINYKNKGILLIGSSGSGKSDLALRLIIDYKAKLVADDRVDLFIKNNKLYGCSPKNIYKKMEIRELGIAEFPAKKETPINLCVELCLNREDFERLPNKQYVDFLGYSIEKIKLYPFDCSTTCKIIAKISSIIS